MFDFNFSFPFAPRFKIFHPVNFWHSSSPPALLGLLLSWQQFIWCFRSYYWLPLSLFNSIDHEEEGADFGLWDGQILLGRSRQHVNTFCKVWCPQESQDSAKRQSTIGMCGCPHLPVCHCSNGTDPLLLEQLQELSLTNRILLENIKLQAQQTLIMSHKFGDIHNIRGSAQHPTVPKQIPSLLQHGW